MPVEWAIHPADRDDLRDLLDSGLLVPVSGGVDAARGLAGRLPPPVDREIVFSRLYWGDAFCHFLLPTRAERRQAEAAASEYGLSLTLATPPLADPELDGLREVLGWLGAGEEVEINDWGVLRLIGAEFGHLQPVLGRALLKALKDPRREGGDRQPAVSKALAGILRRQGVHCVTADVPADPGEFELAVAFPYQFVSSGRICLIGSTSLDTAQRFSLAAPCRRECRDFMLDLQTPDWHLVQKGNTVFAPWKSDQEGQFAAALSEGRVARGIYEAGVDRDRRYLRGQFGRLAARPDMIPLTVLPA